MTHCIVVVSKESKCRHCEQLDSAFLQNLMRGNLLFLKPSLVILSEQIERSIQKMSYLNFSLLSYWALAQYACVFRFSNKIYALRYFGLRPQYDKFCRHCEQLDSAFLQNLMRGNPHTTNCHTGRNA